MRYFNLAHILAPRQCTVCGKLAKWECRECFGECGEGLESTTFCSECVEKVHSHIRRSCHKRKQLTVSRDYMDMEDHCPPPRLYMELFAVICIETSHYVAFVKCGVGHEAPWCFFDSMADRKGKAIFFYYLLTIFTINFHLYLLIY